MHTSTHVHTDLETDTHRDTDKHGHRQTQRHTHRNRKQAGKEGISVLRVDDVLIRLWPEELARKALLTTMATAADRLTGIRW